MNALTVNGLRRTYAVRVPADYDPDAAYPIVIAFHSEFEDVGAMISRWWPLLRQQNQSFIGVFPEGLNIAGSDDWLSHKIDRRWYTRVEGRQQGYWLRHSSGADGEVAFIKVLLDAVSAAWPNADSTRVYATGLGNGGSMCYRLAAKIPHRIRAIAPVSGSIGSSNFANLPTGRVYAVVTFSEGDNHARPAQRDRDFLMDRYGISSSRASQLAQRYRKPKSSLRLWRSTSKWHKEHSTKHQLAVTGTLVWPNTLDLWNTLSAL